MDKISSGIGSVRRLAKALADAAGPVVIASDSDNSETESTKPGYVLAESGETNFERYSDVVLGLAFLVTAAVAARRMYKNRRQQRQQQEAAAQQQQSGGSGAAASSGGAETTVVTAFYSLILLTSLLRALWFLIPSTVWQPNYVPIAVYAWDPEHPAWVGATISEIIVTAGSLSLFSIFILILVYWADILKKYFHPGSRRSLPMVTFLGLVLTLVVLCVINLIAFLAKMYTTEGMVLFHAILLAAVSMVCVCEITIFSHRFRTVLKTLGAINQVSTDSQVRRIVWITVTGNLFFFTRAFLETVFSGAVLVHWHKTGSVDKTFTHFWWDVYVLLKFWSEVAILALMLYILQSRFSTTAATASTGSSAGSRGGYSRVPEAQPLNV